MDESEIRRKIDRDDQIPELVLELIRRIDADMKRNPHLYPYRIEPDYGTPTIPPRDGDDLPSEGCER